MLFTTLTAHIIKAKVTNTTHSKQNWKPWNQLYVKGFQKIDSNFWVKTQLGVVFIVIYIKLRNLFMPLHLLKRMGNKSEIQLSTLKQVNIWFLCKISQC